MTDKERIAALEARLAVYDAFFKFGVSDDGAIPYVMTQGRVGVMTEFWSKKPLGQGAALSIGTAADRFGVYAEIDPGADGFAACPDQPSTAIFASVVVPHRPGEPQPNIAIGAVAANAPVGNLPFHGTYQYAPTPALLPTEGLRLVEMSADGQVQRHLSISANGITLMDGVQRVAQWFVRKIGGPLKNLWP